MPKISAYPPMALPLSGSEILLGDQSGGTSTTPVSSITSLITLAGLGGTTLAAALTAVKALGYVSPRIYVASMLGCKEDNATDDSTAFNAILTTIGNTPATIWIDGPMYLNSSITMGSNVQVQFVGNGMVKPGIYRQNKLDGLAETGSEMVTD